MLKALEISGFKSFAKKTALSFNAPITAIVGPNGSGKSNVAESFRFALGEQSMKSLRGKRGEDLIWNGSQEVPRAGRASVKLVFDNNPSSGKRLFTLDFDDVSVERLVSRDGENEYSINGSRVRLKDVIELLAQAHIGSSSHQIISQGEADRILRASSKERREMIEDALGLKIYQYKREESLRKLEKTGDNIKQAESLRREIAPHLRFLKKQMEKFERAEELRQTLVGFYKEYLKREKVYLDTYKKDLRITREPLEHRQNELAGIMQNAKEVLESSSQKDKKSEKLIEVENQIESARREKDLLERKIGKIEGEKIFNDRSLQKARELAESEDTRVVKVREVERLAEEVFLLTDIEAIFRKIKDFVALFKNKVDLESIEDLRMRSLDLDRELAKLDSELQQKEAKLREFSDTYANVKASIERENNSQREAEKTIFRISAEQSEVRSKLELMREKERQLRIEEEEFLNQVREGSTLLGQAVLSFEQIDTMTLTTDDSRDRQIERKRELEKMKIRLEELGGAGGLEVKKEYDEVSERDKFLARELEDLEKSAESLQTLIKDLEDKLDNEFRQGIDKVNQSFQKFFSTMFDGGTAELKIEKLKIQRWNEQKNEVEDENMSEEEPEEQEAGIEIAVSLPRKRIKGLEMLSGGERALTSIALLFAISQVNPPPFIILDETDAALDEANSKKYGDMIESLSKYSQLILITHNRETMSRAGIIYGVTMGRDGVSRLLSIAFDEAVAVAK